LQLTLRGVRRISYWILAKVETMPILLGEKSGVLPDGFIASGRANLLVAGGGVLKEA